MKEAQKYFIKEWGTGFIDAILQSEKGMVRMSMQDIYETMQSYTKEQVDKALKEKGKELLNFQEEIISNPIRFNGVNHKVIERLMNIEPEF